MRTKILYILVITALGFLAYKTLINKQSTLGKSETRFTLEHPEEVTRIKLKQDQQEIVLEKQADIWEFNGSKANQERVQHLLILSSLIEVLSPVALSDKEKVTTELSQGVTVEFFRNKHKIHKYKVCTWNQQLYATAGRSKNPYRIKISTFTNVNLTSYVEPCESKWNENLLFATIPDSIRKIRLTFPTMPGRGFQIESDTALLLKDEQGNNLTDKTKPDILKQYLRSFEDIRYEVVHTTPDTINKGNMFFQLVICYHNSTSHTVTGYLKTERKSGKTDPKKFYAHAEGLEYISLNYNDFDPILLPVYYFLKK